METTPVKAFGNTSAEASLEQLTIQWRQLTAHDIEIDIFYVVFAILTCTLHAANDQTLCTLVYRDIK